MTWDLITATAIAVEESGGVSVCVWRGSDKALILAAILQHLWMSTRGNYLIEPLGAVWKSTTFNLVKQQGDAQGLETDRAKESG